MKNASEVPAILTIHRTSPGQYIVRVGDLRYRPLVVAVSKLLEDATSLVVVTPADIKVIRVSGSSVSEESRKGTVASPPSEDEAAGPEVPVESLDAETQAAIREQEQHSLPGLNEGSEPSVNPEPGMRVVRRKSNGQFAGHSETCGRCHGAGHIAIMDESGGAGRAPCGVCQGSGVLTRYGSPRH